MDDRPGAAQPISQGYEYDDLHRLVEARRGTWNGTSVPTGAGSQRWRDDFNNVTLDALGNWRQSWIDWDGDGSYADATERDDRTHDLFNRIVGHVLKGQGSGGSDLNLGDLAYDRASNLASWKLQSGTSATAVTAKHDAWNRLTEISFGGTLRCRQAHNALHWRSFQLSDRTGAGAAPDGTMDQARLMSYGADWRLLEERVDDNLSLSAWTEGTWSPGTDLDRVQQYVWGTRYVDDIVLHRVDRNMDGDYSDAVDGTWHHLTDAQFSSVCLIDKAFAVAERVSYSAYGVARHLPMADMNCDGAVNSADIGLLLGASGTIGDSTYESPADLNRDGVVDSADLAMLLGDFQAAQPDGALSRPNVDNPIGWDGYVFDSESGLYTVRFRTYETGLGRWIQRDPAGYVDGNAFYQYVGSAPSFRSDPLGLAEVCGPRVWLFTGWWCVEEEVWEAAHQVGGEVAHDNAQGFGDYVGIEDLMRTGHTFDPRERARGNCYLGCLTWGIADRILLQAIKDNVLGNLGGNLWIGLGTVTDISLCDFPELKSPEPWDLTQLPAALGRISDSLQRYLQRKLDEGFERAIRRRDPLRSPGESLKQAQRNARDNYKQMIKDLEAGKSQLERLGKLFDKAQLVFDMGKLATDCYKGCDENPCASPCEILRRTK